MKCLERNKVEFWYALYTGREAMTDDDGNITGEYALLYGQPAHFRANISAAKGETESRQFGENLVYDRVIVSDKTCPPIDEYSILWVDIVPALDNDGNLSLTDDGEIATPHDYIVKKVAPGLNQVSIAISKVTVSG